MKIATEFIILIDIWESKIKHFKLWNKLYFLHKAHHSFLHLGTLGSISALHVWTIINNKVANKEHKMQTVTKCEL